MCNTRTNNIFQLSKFVSHNRITPAAISYGDPVISVGWLLQRLAQALSQTIAESAYEFCDVYLSANIRMTPIGPFFFKISFVEFLLIFSSFFYLRLVGQISHFT